MFPQWGFWVLWFLHGVANFGCLRESWFFVLAAHSVVIGLTLSLKLSTCSKNSPEVDQNSLLSQFTSNSVSASHLLLHIQVVVLNFGAHKKVWIVMSSWGIPTWMGCVNTAVKYRGTVEDFTSLSSKLALPVY